MTLAGERLAHVAQARRVIICSGEHGAIRGLDNHISMIAG